MKDLSKLKYNVDIFLLLAPTVIYFFTELFVLVSSNCAPEWREDDK